MTTISVIYPRDPTATFDYGYYEEQHLPLVVKRWRGAGLVDAQALRGISALDGSEAPFFAIALIRFELIGELPCSGNGRACRRDNGRHSKVHERSTHSSEREHRRIANPRGHSDVRFHPKRTGRNRPIADVATVGRRTHVGPVKVVVAVAPFVCRSRRSGRRT